ncbi:hypothetical protein HUN42_00070 [Streptomyces phage Dagobah]|nr:hypothetical protein HUN42_00070 [Streptomyces phage Dagobah]
MPVDEPLKLAQCPRCSTPVHRWKVGGIEYTADLTALDGPGATAAVLGGRKLYRITAVGPVRNIRPAYTKELAALGGAEPPTIVGGHPCTALTRPLAAPQQSGGATPPGKAPGPAAGRTAPSPVPSSRTSRTARTADRRRTDPVCDQCGQPCADGTYASIALGDLVVWAQHVTGECAETGI